MVCGTSREPQYIKAYNKCYDPLLYPLFSPRGEASWNKKILYADQGDPLENIVYRLFFSLLVPKQYLMFQLMEMSMLARTKLWRKGTKVSFW
jgi:hypothetical protein